MEQRIAELTKKIHILELERAALLQSLEPSSQSSRSGLRIGDIVTDVKGKFEVGTVHKVHKVYMSVLVPITIGKEAGYRVIRRYPKNLRLVNNRDD